MFEFLLALGNQKIDIKNRLWRQFGPVTDFGIQYGAASVDGIGYIFGGRIGVTTGARSTSWKFTGTTLTAIKALPKTLVAHTCSVVGTKIYILGGSTSISNGTENKQVIIYDTLTDDYTYGTNCPVNSVVGGSVAIGTDIYLYGGMASQVESGFPKVFYKYDTIADTWTALTYHNGPALYNVSIVNLEGMIYTFGGEYNNANSKDNIVRIYNPTTQTWSYPTVTGTLPSPRGTFGVRYDDNIFVILGGRVVGTTTYSNESWSFDKTTLTWTKLANYPSAIGFQQVLPVNRLLYSFSGYTGTAIFNGTYRFN